MVLSVSANFMKQGYQNRSDVKDIKFFSNCSPEHDRHACNPAYSEREYSKITYVVAMAATGYTLSSSSLDDLTVVLLSCT